MMLAYVLFFFFKQKTAYEMRISDWSSDVCSSDLHTQAAWDDEPRLAAFAAACDAVTLEFENVPVDTLRFLSGHVAVRPGAAALEIAQDRLAEKRFVAGLGGRTAPFAAVSDRAALDAAIAGIGAPAILQTVRMGYDGKEIGRAHV